MKKMIKKINSKGDKVNQFKIGLFVLTAAFVFQFCLISQAQAAGIYSVSPNIIIPGETEITISGYDFGDYSEGKTVYFADSTGSNKSVSDYNYWNNSQIKLKAPYLNSGGDVWVKICSSGNSCLALYKTTFYFKPKIYKDFTKTSGKAGDEINICGNNFGKSRGAVILNGLNAEVTYWGNNWACSSLAKIKVPNGAQSGDLIVRNSNGNASDGVYFEVLQSPNINANSDIEGNFSQSNNNSNTNGVYMSVEESGLVNPPSTIAIRGNNQKILSNLLSFGHSFISNRPIVYFEWTGASAPEGVAGYFVEFTDKTNADPSKTGRFQTTSAYRAYDLSPNQDYFLNIRTVDKKGNLSKIQSFTYRFEQDANKLNKNLTNRLKGRILLQVESQGEAWYLNPANGCRYYLNDADGAFKLMRNFGLGIKNADLTKIPTENSASKGDANLINRLKGRILLQVESQGEAWYLNPANGKRYYLGNPEDAFRLMKNLSLGITDYNLEKILVASAD